MGWSCNTNQGERKYIQNIVGKLLEVHEDVKGLHCIGSGGWIGMLDRRDIWNSVVSSDRLCY